MKSLTLLVAVICVASFFSTALAQDCYKNTTGRGVGVPVNSCPEGLQLDAGLCYTPCKVNFTGIGPVCWQNCPAGFTDTGAFCQPNTVWGDNSACPASDKCGLISAKGCVVCPAGMVDNGCLCSTPGSLFAKQTYGRGVGTPMVCSPELQYDAGLCYPECGPDSNGVGPVCWSYCPGNAPYTCGAICTTDEDVCKSTVDELAQTLYQLLVQLVECVEEIASCNISQLKADIQNVIAQLNVPMCNSEALLSWSAK